MPNPHNEVISAMLEVLEPMKGEIRLIGRVNDPVIGNASARELFFFIPDLHLLSSARQQRFGKYGFNYSGKGVLTKLLSNLAKLRKTWEDNDGNKLVTVQLGDFFDMWREFPTSVKPEEVPDDAHGDLRDILYRNIDRGGPCLKATMILGNHDTRNGVPLNEINFKFKTFNRTGDEKPFLFVTHGDAFDILEKTVPAPIKEFAVYFAGASTPTNKYYVGNWGKYAGKINKPMGQMDEAIMKPEHQLDPTGGSPKVIAGATLPSFLCREIAAPEEADHKLFGDLYTAIEEAGKEGLAGQHAKIVAVGHTHKASMILCRPRDGSRPMVLMDVGAWIEKCRYRLAENGEVVTELSAQLGAIHGNDARIYQIRLPEGKEG